MLRKFDFRNKWSIASGNRGNGLDLLWKEEIRITVEDSSKYCIDVLVEKILHRNGDSQASIVNW